MTDSRTRLLDAAEELLWERGVSATSPRAVLEHSGVGQGSLYHHFPTKTALAHAAMDRIVHRSLASALADLAEPGDAIDVLAGYLLQPRPGTKGCTVGRHTNDPALALDDDLSGAVGGYFVELHDALVEVLRSRPAPPLLAERAEEIADTVLATVQGGFVLARATGDQEYMDRAVRGLVALLRASTAGSAAR